MRQKLIIILGLLSLSLATCKPTPAETPASQPTTENSPTETASTAESEDPPTDNETPLAEVTDEADGMAIELSTLPVIPEVTNRTREIYARGQSMGRNPAVFSKVGDCMTTSVNFLMPFSHGEYDLGQHAHLEETINYFAETDAREYEGEQLDSFTSISAAATEGFNSASVMEPLWANPAWCEQGESPLACEYRVSNGAYTLVMFGTNDVYAFEPAKFDGYMRTVLDTTIEMGIVPILITFPPQPDLYDKSKAMNEVVASLAHEYDIPLINLWAAVQDLPNYGIDPEQTNHLLEPDDGCMACFDEEHMQFGITVQNFAVISTLDVMRASLTE